MLNRDQGTQLGFWTKRTSSRAVDPVTRKRGARTYDKVELLLSTSQQYRDSDKKLLLAYWENEGLYLTEDQRRIFLNRCTVAESITRQRRILKEKYPASKVVDEGRYRKFKKFRGGEYE